MQVILLENIYNLGKIGDEVKVKDGYGRNYLLKTGKAWRANNENIKFVNSKKEELNKKNLQRKKEFQEKSSKINRQTLIFKKMSKENGDLYGTIKPKEISQEFEKKFNIEVKPAQIFIRQSLNRIGNYEIEVNFHPEVSAKINLKIDKIDTVK